MNSKQNAKLNMAQRVSDTMAAHAADYSGIAPMVSAVGELTTNIVDIREAEKQQESVSVSASSQQKREAEARMIDTSVKAANALHVIGITSGDKVLTNLSAFNPTKFSTKEDNAKIALAAHISELAQEHVSELAAYGFSSEQIVDIQTSIDAYKKLIAKPMETIGERKEKTTKLKKLFVTMDSIFGDKLDKLIVLFKDSNPSLYNEYRTARNIIGMSARRKRTTEV